MSLWWRDESEHSAPWFRLTLSVRLGSRRLRLRSPRRWQWLLIVAGLFVGYALSPVPVAITLYYLPANPVPDEAIIAAYFPLVVAIEYVPGVDAFYQWYFECAKEATGLPLVL
jgi:hypothetical protein